jgi:outer membrane lipoprotein SlyB
MRTTKYLRLSIKAALVLLPAIFFTPVAHALCNECGTVTNVKTVKIAGTGSGAGVVAGGILGGVLGNQVGAGSGKDLATIGGVVGGAYVGNQAEKKSKETTQYRVSVKMENGKSKTFKFSSPTSYRIGDKVVVKDGALTRQ